MATVKVKFRPSSVAGKAGRIYYQVAHRGRIRQIATRFRIQTGQWDFPAQRLAAPATEEEALVRQCIDSDLAALAGIIRRLEAAARPYDADEVVCLFVAPQHRETILAYMRRQIEHLNSCRRFGTARNYLRAMNSLSRYLGDEDLPIRALNESLVEGYGAFLRQRGVVRNSISFYMRILRSVYNKAVRQHLAEQSYPFRSVYTGIDRTSKRAVDESVIIRLFRLDLDASGPLSRARDLFIFSYCTRGMAFVDMAYLRKSDIRGGAIHYTRHKTGQQLSVRIEPPVQRIIDRYWSRSSVYLLPVLDTEEPAAAFVRYRTALNYYNRQLKRLAAMLHLDSGLSSYTARHSWATAARNHDVPLSVISAGMGHASERTTQIYLSRLENSVVDSANRRIVGNLR